MTAPKPQWKLSFTTENSELRQQWKKEGSRKHRQAGQKESRREQKEEAETDPVFVLWNQPRLPQLLSKPRTEKAPLPCGAVRHIPGIWRPVQPHKQGSGLNLNHQPADYKWPTTNWNSLLGIKDSQKCKNSKLPFLVSAVFTQQILIASNFHMKQKQCHHRFKKWVKTEGTQPGRGMVTKTTRRPEQSLHPQPRRPSCPEHWVGQGNCAGREWNRADSAQEKRRDREPRVRWGNQPAAAFSPSNWLTDTLFQYPNFTFCSVQGQKSWKDTEKQNFSRTERKTLAGSSYKSSAPLVVVGQFF